MEGIITWFQANGGDLVAIAVAFIMLFERIALLTPTETDNKILEYIYKISKFLGLKFEDNTGNKDK
jgi:hypothetical protein